MRSQGLLAALAVALVACGGGGDTQRLGAASPAPSRTGTPTATQPINVDDMMGLYAQQTVFVGSPGQVAAVTLLNHFTRYRIPTTGIAQASTDSTRTWLYVLDAADGVSRLRVFGIAGGAEQAAVGGITGVASDRRAIATAIDGRVLVLKANDRRSWVDAYDSLTLRPLGSVMEADGCGDRLLVSGDRIAVVCLATGAVTIGLPGGAAQAIGPVLAPLVAATIAGDGAIYIATADQRLAVIERGTTRLERMAWPAEWSGAILPDGIAVSQEYGQVVVAQHASDGVWLRVFDRYASSRRHSSLLSGTPQGGVLVLFPFAYYVSGSAIRHVELTSGLLETMTDVGAGSVPLAVVDR